MTANRAELGYCNKGQMLVDMYWTFKGQDDKEAIKDVEQAMANIYMNGGDVVSV